MPDTALKSLAATLLLLATAFSVGCSSERAGETMSAPEPESVGESDGHWDGGPGFDEEPAFAGEPAFAEEPLIAEESAFAEESAIPEEAWPEEIEADDPVLAEPGSDVEAELAMAMESTAPTMSLEPPLLPDGMSPGPVLPNRSVRSADTASVAPTPPTNGGQPLPVEPTASSTGPFESLPAGATHDAEKGFATIAVYYATDRARNALPLSAYDITGNRDALILLSISSLAFLLYAGYNFLRRRTQSGLAFGCFGGVAAAGAAMVVLSGTANIEKHGVTYNGDRGPLVTGIAEVTVPDKHDRGVVERPSLLRFEVREDQQEHIVLTSAVELSGEDFKRRLAETVAISPNQDLLVFIHGYNVDFESAVRRTAQLAVDLPFEGVPVCYSWPSQGTLFGYTVDETNAAWTQSHLKQFLLDLAKESGAQSINVVAHSMGNRPTTGAMVEIGWEQKATAPSEPDFASATKLFDRVVLAAPDVDADRFRRDVAPALTKVADHVTLYASSDDQALVASKQVHGYPRAGESGDSLVVVPGIETIDVSGIDLSLLGHSYYGDSPSMLKDLYQVVRDRLPATQRRQLAPQSQGELVYWRLIKEAAGRRMTADPRGTEPRPVR